MSSYTHSSSLQAQADHRRLHAQARRRAHALRQAALNDLGQGWLAGVAATGVSLRRRITAVLAGLHTWLRRA